jgi:deazaflavin-dependent oxidoreductase (nitroreductase family)
MHGLIAGVVLGALLAHWAGRRSRGGTERRARREAAAGVGADPLLSERLRTAPPARLLFRTPALLYDLGLGRLLGHRFLRLTHRGRRSGRLYRTVLEVLSYDPATRESVVLSAWGERADWYRNIRAAPALEVLSAGQRFAPAQRLVDAGELYAHLQQYVARHRSMRGLVTRTLGLALDGSEADRAALEARAIAAWHFDLRRTLRGHPRIEHRSRTPSSASWSTAGSLTRRLSPQRCCQV